MSTNYCSGLGWLCPAKVAIPTDPGTFAAPGMPGVIPCSHLVCSGCGANVRALPGLQFVGETSSLPAAWAASDPLEVDGVVEGLKEARLYLCRCSRFSAMVVVSLQVREDMPELGLPTTWSCGGHAAQTGPVIIQGRSIPADPDWPAFIEATLRDPVPKGEHVLSRVKWLREARGVLSGTPHAEAIDATIDSMLDSDDSFLRGHAIHYLWSVIASPSIDRLRDLLLNDPETLAEQPDPFGLPDLYDSVVRAVGFHLDRSRWPLDDELLAALRAQAARPDRLDGVGWFLARHDGPWFLENVDALVASSPRSATKAQRWKAQAGN